MHYFTFNGTNSYEYGLFVNAVSAFNAPQWNVDTVAVPGRNGDLILSNNRMNNIVISYEIGITSDFINKSRDVAAWLLADASYHTLTNSFDTGHYRTARFYGDVSYTVNALYETGKATIYFDCMPQLWLTSGDTAVSFSADGTITNPTQFDAKPIIRVYGSGTITINGYELTVDTSDATSYIDIDCERMQCYEGTTNMNSYVTVDEFPVLSPGSNTIETSVNIEITPRWWTV